MGTLRKFILRLSVILFIPLILQGHESELTGRIFSDYTYTLENQENQFDIRRVYLNFRGDIHQNVSYRVTTDAGLTETGYTLFLKYALFNWSPSHMEDLNVHFGMIPTSTFEVQKRTWGLRYVDKTIFNRNRIVSSADIGIRLDKEINNIIHLSALISNGEGYKNPEANKYKQVHLRGVVGQSDLSTETGYNIGGYASYERISASTNKLVYIFFAGLHHQNLWLGGEIGHVSQQSDRILGSIYGRYAVSGNSQIFLRTDVIDSSGNRQISLFAGCEYQVVENLNFAPNIVYITDEHNTQTLLRMNVQLIF